MFDPPPLPPAGWYPNPEHPGGPHRWWNGTSWNSPYAPTTGAPSGLPDIGEWLNRSFARMWRHWRALAMIALVTSVPSGILVSLALRRAFEGLVVTDDELIGWSNDRLPAVITMTIVACALGVVGGIAGTWLMLRTTDADSDPQPDLVVETTAITSQSEVESAVRSFGAALRALPRVIGWSIVITLAVAVAVAVLVMLFVFAWPIGILVALAYIPLGFFFGVRYAFIFTAMVDRGGNPFARSAQVTRGRFWPTFGRMALIGIIIYGISIAVNLPTSVASGNGFGGAFGDTGGIRRDDDGVFESFDLATVAPTNAAIVVGAIAALISGVVIAGLAGAALAELYRTRNPAD